LGWLGKRDAPDGQTVGYRGAAETADGYVPIVGHRESRDAADDKLDTAGRACGGSVAVDASFGVVFAVGARSVLSLGLSPYPDVGRRRHEGCPPGSVRFRTVENQLRAGSRT
jgi:hypothetical protein